MHVKIYCYYTAEEHSQRASCIHLVGGSSRLGLSGRRRGRGSSRMGSWLPGFRPEAREETRSLYSLIQQVPQLFFPLPFSHDILIDFPFLLLEILNFLAQSLIRTNGSPFSLQFFNVPLSSDSLLA